MLLFDVNICLVGTHDETMASQVEPNAHKIEEHRRKYDRLRKEREDRKIERERQRRRAEAQVIPLIFFLHPMLIYSFLFLF